MSLTTPPRYPLWSVCQLQAILLTLPVLGCASSEPSEELTTRQRMQLVVGCVSEQAARLFASDRSESNLSWNADKTVATIEVRNLDSVQAVYRVELRWDAISIESQTSSSAAEEVALLARETRMHDICLSKGGF